MKTEYRVDFTFPGVEGVRSDQMEIALATTNVNSHLNIVVKSGRLLQDRPIGICLPIDQLIELRDRLTTFIDSRD